MMFLFTIVAGAQTFDASGPALPPDGASARDPLTTFGGRPVGSGAVSVTLEGASGLLVREVRDGPYVRVESVLDSIFGGTLAASLGRGRFGLGITAPIWLAVTSERGSNPALGDIRVWAPISLLNQPKHYLLSVVPFVKLPTGADKRYLGDPFGAGLLVSGAVHAGPLSTGLDVGFDAAPGTKSEDWPGGVTGLFAGAIGLASKRVGVHLEARGKLPFRSVLSVPSEALLTLKGSPVDRLWLTVGGGTALTRGPGAASPRFFVGATYSLAPKGVDPEAPPEARASEVKELYVLDQSRFPVSNVQVSVGKELLATDPEGFADVPRKLFLREGLVRLEHPAYLTVDLTDLDIEAEWWEVVLQRKPVEVAVSVVGPDGEPMLTGVAEMRSTADPPLDPGPVRIDELGVHHWSLPPGTNWVVVMTGERMGGQARVIDIKPERIEPIRVDTVLAWAVDPTTKLTVTVVDGAGDAVEDAAVAVENRDFGTTGPGGIIEIGGLPRGEHAVTVRSALYGEANVADVTVGDDAQVKVVLQWPPGAVVARVTDSDGRPLDAQVSFAGPASLPPRQVGSDGEKLFVLRPGEWTLTLAYEGLASQERRVSVTEEAGVLREVVATLVPVPPGQADVVVRVADDAGKPMAGVTVALDGEKVGETGADGTVTLLDLAVGERTVTANGQLLLPAERKVELVDGRQVVELGVAFVPGVVDVRVESNGTPVDVTIQARGDRPVPPMQSGPDGEQRLVLPPGVWDLSVTTPDGKVVERTVTVTDAPLPQEVLFQVLDGESSVAVKVVDAAGAPVANAAVLLGDLPVGTTDAAGELAIENVEAGPAALTVKAPGFQPGGLQVEVPAASGSAAPAQVTLDRAPEQVQLTVVGPDGPVASSVQVRSEKGLELSQNLPAGTSGLELPPGRYHVVIESDGLETTETVFEIRAQGATPPLDVELGVRGSSPTVVFAVEDVTGAPVANAPVLIEGVEVGRTSEAGTIVLSEPPARGNVVIRPSEGLREVQVPIARADGGVFVAEEAERPVPVAVSGEAGAAGNVTVRVAGLETAVETGADGTATLQLLPGTWTVTTEQDGKVAAQTVTVPRTGAPPLVELSLATSATVISNGILKLERPLLFDLDSASIRPDTLELLDDVARLLKTDRTAALIEVGGHTDDQGGVVYNQSLSERRADAVRRALITRGVEPERLVRRGYGLSRPVASGEQGRERNRRVELSVLETVR